MSKADDLFWRQFGAILIGLTLFTLAMVILARVIAGGFFEEMMNSPALVEARIQPVAKVRVGDPGKSVAAPKPAAAAAAPAPSAAAADGESVYNSACTACHVAGVAGAPKLGDKAAWEARLGLGEDALVASVLKGKGAMPAKGGNPALSEEQIRAAVQYMIAAVSDAAAAPAATQEAPEEVAPAQGTAAASAETSAATQVAASSATTEVAAAGSAGKPGDEVYNGICMACHVAGVANAPKLTDKDAWTTRAANGFDSLVGNVLKGKGAMPAKGGNPALEQADLENAVRYMLEQAGVSAAGS